MNKNFKKIIAFTIICTAFSTFTPLTLNMRSQYAYAYSDNQITNLKISSGVSGIPFYSGSSQKSDYKIKIGDKIPLIIYSTISSDQASINLSTIDANASNIRVFIGKDYVKLPDIHNEIKIEKGEKKAIYIRLYDSINATDNEYTIEYSLFVKREDNGEDETDVEDEIPTGKEYDNIYLEKLLLSHADQTIDFNFDKTKITQNINVDESFSYITLKAVPEQESYDLRINDKAIDTKGNNKYTKDISLDEGKNLVKIRIFNDNHESREYYLIITRGIDTSKTTQTTTSNNTSSNNSSQQNQQVNVNAGWLYRKADGTMATGWTYIGNSWYYFDTTGTMKTGWLQDTNGKWYYLNQSGVMVKNTTIDGYKIGSDGAYIKK